MKSVSFKKKFKSYFVSPIAYIVIAIFLLVAGWFFFGGTIDKTLIRYQKLKRYTSLLFVFEGQKI